MKHTAEVVEYKKLSNGQFSVLIRCCANPSTDSWHTMAAEVLADKKKRKESISSAMLRVAKQHEDAMKASEAGVEMMGESKEVDI